MSTTVTQKQFQNLWKAREFWMTVNPGEVAHELRAYVAERPGTSALGVYPRCGAPACFLGHLPGCEHFAQQGVVALYGAAAPQFLDEDFGICQGTRICEPLFGWPGLGHVRGYFLATDHLAFGMDDWHVVLLRLNYAINNSSIED